MSSPIRGALRGLEIGDGAVEMGSVLLIGIGVIAGVYVLLRMYLETRRGLERALSTERHQTQCPNCGETNRQDESELIPSCPECGFTPGRPVLRWATRSLPAIELRRSITASRLFVLGVAVALLGAGTFGVGLATTETAAPTPVNDMSTAEVGPLNTTETEVLIVQYVNAERTKEGLNELDFDPTLANASRDAAETMVTKDSIGQELRTNGQEGNRYGGICAGPVGESAVGAWYGSTFSTWNSEGDIYLKNEADLARYVLEQWRSAEGSQSTMLAEDWEQTGVGVAVREDGKVYVVQAYC